LVFKKRGTNLSVQFKPPIDIDYSKTIDEILDIIMDAIEQSAEFKLKGRHHRLQPS
jgi:hypothetical protein